MSCIIRTMKELQTQTNQTVDEPLEDLTAEEITFSHLVANGKTLTQAYRQAFPSKKHLANYTIRRYASDLYTKANILTEVASHQAKTALLARQAEDRLEEILTDGDINDKHNRVADVAMFMYDHANGKAITKIQAQSKHVVVTYNLGGTDAGPVPQEILDQLAD